MKLRYIVLLLIAELLFWIQTSHAEAHPVISEVMWAGSDQSSSDEWYELFLPPCDGCSAEDLGGWTVTYLKSTGQETLMLTFPAGFTMQPDASVVISNNHADNSRLLAEPSFISASLTLANSGLRLRLKDPSGVVIDEVDDGVGVPFAGANPSAPSPKTSMERIDAAIAGTVKENWKSATTSRGLDAGSTMLATPGFQNGSVEISASPSSASSSSSSSVESSSSSCISDLLPTISLQSGDFTGVGKVTLNVQAAAVEGTMNGATCHFDFGDGYRSDSCNPPVHSYDQSGVYSINLTVENQCGTTLIQTQVVTVFPDTKSPSSSSSVAGSPQVFDDSRIVISGVLPNPDSKDADKEWIELTNLEDHGVPLAGWHLAIGNKTIHRFLIDTVSQLAAHETVRLYQSETGISLSNAADRVDLVSPQGTVVSSVHWDKTEEGRVYKSDSFKDSKVFGTVSQIIDAEHFTVAFDGPSSRGTGLSQATISLIGITGFDSQESSGLSSYTLQSLEFVRTLIENKKVELFFDAVVWDDDDNLLAYVALDDGRILQKELLLSGLGMADVSFAYASRQNFVESQKKAMKAKSGIWSVLDLPPPSYGGGAQNKAQKVASILDSPIIDLPDSYGKILITEVFPSPSSKESSGSILGEEWIEFFNPEPRSFSLDGWMMNVGKKSMTFGSSSMVDAGKHVVFLVHQTGLKLKNDGDRIDLFSPDKSYKASVDYPKTKIGESYVFDEHTESWCRSRSPSAGERGSCSVLGEAAISKAKATVGKTKAAASKPRKSVYDKYAATYNAALQNSAAGSIVLASPEASSSSSFLLVTLGTLFGTLCSIGVLSIGRVREWVFGAG